MATPFSTHKNKSTQNPITFSQLEIEAAKQLIELSSGDSAEDHPHSSNSNNNSCSYSVVQGKPHHNKVDSGAEESSTAATGEVVLSESEDESFATPRKRYRYIHELYSVTAPVSEVKLKMMKFRK